MKVALTAWENRISPVFDSARTLLIAEVEDAKVVARRYAPIRNESICGLEKMLRDLEIDVLICGAISRPCEFALSAAGIEEIRSFPSLLGEPDQDQSFFEVYVGRCVRLMTS